MRFLIIDDNPADRELIVHKLRKEFDSAEFVTVGLPGELEAATKRGIFDIILTDYQLNWSDGLQILDLMKVRFPDVPVVMFTGTGSEEIAVEGLRAGLSNYVLKKHLDRLPYAVRDSLEKARLRKQYEEAIQQLRASEERYREIFEQGLTGVFAFTPQGRLLTCNSAFARIFGFASVEEAMQVNVRALYPQPQHFDAFLKLLAHEKRFEYHEMEMQRCDGVPLYIVENVVGSFDDDGRLVEVKGYLFDNTERRRLTEQLQQAQKLESVGLLVSGIAHDFNNMLGGILGYAGRGLGRVTQSHPLYSNLHHIQEIATRAARMTQQLLAFSRRQVLEPSAVNLNIVVDTLLDFISKVLGEHIEIEFVPDPDLKTVHVDYSQIEQVLMNLCINARDAMPRGGRLTIRTRNVNADEAYTLGGGQSKPEAYVQISVQDSGVGMSELVRERIFEPFFTTKELGKGTGLGLSMVHGIIGQHNGFIDVESEEGKGTIFSLYLPCTDGVSAPETLPAESRSAQTVVGGDETILVVEDDPDLRCLMEEALGDYGYTVMSASDGLEGLQQFEEHGNSIALVISDLMTPKMMGKELYDKIHTMSDATRFLFVSGYQANQISQNFVLDKGFYFLQKPFDLDELAAKVREILA
ncbi:MAG TPA: response regulator [Ktedonobacteraceae bacterium]|nr:response regulator [Ktedonobacteraceae bacterium]